MRLGGACRLGVEQGLIGSGGQLIWRFAGLEGGQPNRDPDAKLASERFVDLEEPSLGVDDIDAAKAAQELVTAIANDRIERPKSRSDEPNERLQNEIAGSVPVSVVDALHVVDVNERQDEAPVGAAGAVDLVGDGESAHAATVGTGQVVEVSGAQPVLESSPFQGGQGSIRSGAFAIGGRASAIRSRLGSEQPHLVDEWSVGGVNRSIDGLGARIAPPGAFISGRGHGVALTSAQHARRCGRLAVRLVHHPRLRAGFTFLARQFIRFRVGIRGSQLGGLVSVGRGLVTIGGSLVALGGRLIPFRPGLVRVLRGLIGVRTRLVGTRSRLIGCERLPEIRAGGGQTPRLVSVGVRRIQLRRLPRLPSCELAMDRR